MGIPLIPFAAGLAVGALATYGSRDATVQKEVKEGAAWLMTGAERLYGSMLSGVAGLMGLGSTKKPAKPSRRTRAKATEEPADKAPPRKRTRAKKPEATTAAKRTATRARRKTAKAAAA